MRADVFPFSFRDADTVNSLLVVSYSVQSHGLSEAVKALFEKETPV